MLSSVVRFGVFVVVAASSYDLRALAGQAVAAADAYVEAAGSLPSLSQVASDMDKRDAEAIASLEASAKVQQEQQRLDDDLSVVIANRRGRAGAAFLQAAPEVANIHLVEPGRYVLKAAVSLRKQLADALAALEVRQASDEALYASVLASSQALTREAVAAKTS
jgi:hypothetical protein